MSHAASARPNVTVRGQHVAAVYIPVPLVITATAKDGENESELLDQIIGELLARIVKIG